MSEVSTIGLDLAKNVFRLHGADASGSVMFRKRLRRDQVLRFLAAQSACTVAMVACASGHYWGREIAKLGHGARLIAPGYVKPFVKRQKNDAADAEAICKAAQRPTMRFVAVKSEEQQAAAVVFRARDLLVRQRTQTINAIRGHLAEFGIVAAKGPFHVAKLKAAIEDKEIAIPDLARPILHLLVEQLRWLDEKVALLDWELARRAKEDADAKRLMTIPGIRPITATALVALAPAAQTFKRGRDCALGNAQGLDNGPLACARVEPQATHAGDRRSCQQDGTHRLGIDGERRNLSSSGCGGAVPPRALNV